MVRAASEEPDFHPTEPGIQRAIYCPILHEGRALGLISLEAEATPLIAADLHLLTALSGPVGVALEHAELLQDWNERGNRLAAANLIAQAATKGLDFQEVLAAAMERLPRLLPVNWGALALLSDDGKVLEIAAVLGATGGPCRRGWRLPVEGSLFGEVVQTGRP